MKLDPLGLALAALLLGMALGPAGFALWQWHWSPLLFYVPIGGIFAAAGGLGAIGRTS